MKSTATTDSGDPIPQIPPYRTFIVRRPGFPDATVFAHEWFVTNGGVAGFQIIRRSPDPRMLVMHTHRAFSTPYDVEEVVSTGASTSIN